MFFNQIGHLMPITYLLLTSHLQFTNYLPTQMYYLFTNPPTYLNVIPTYLPAYPPTYNLLKCIIYLPTYLPTYPPTHLHGCTTYLPSHTPIYIHVLRTYTPTHQPSYVIPTDPFAYLLTHPPTHQPISYLPSYFIIL